MQGRTEQSCHPVVVLLSEKYHTTTSHHQTTFPQLFRAIQYYVKDATIEFLVKFYPIIM